MTKSKLIILISSIVAAIAIALTVTLIIVLRPKAEPSNNGSIGEARSIKIVALEGSATLTDGNEKIDCFKGMNLYDGDHIDVLDNSVLVARFDEDKYVYFAENTSINIKSSGKDKYKTNIFVEKGKVLAELINKLGEDEEFFLSSNNSVMAVRGTTFGVEVKDKGNEFEISYSVYKGVTELFVFDKNENDFISGKLSDISNQKLTLTIPKDHILDANTIKDMVGEWLENVKSIFDDETDANEKLDEVQIVVSTPTKEDYDEIIELLSKKEEDNKEITPVKEDDKKEPEIKYSDITYQSSGFFGNYDGLGHGINVECELENSKITYKGENETEYKETNDYLFYVPGSYRVYYKIECEGYITKEDYEVVIIAKPIIRLTSDNINYDAISQSSMANISSLSNSDFNIYNGVKASVLLANAKYYIGNDELKYKNINIKYNNIVDGFIELVDGKNTLDVSFEFDDYSLNAEVNFYFSDLREDLGYVVGALGNDVELLDGNLYYISLSAFDIVDEKYQIEGNKLLTELGLDVQDLRTMFINTPYVYYDSTNEELSNYNGTKNFEFNIDEFNKVNFVVYPTSSTKGYNETIYLFVSSEAPTEFPEYSIKKLKYTYNPDKNPNGVLIDFIESENEVTYSLDKATYQENLYIKDAGSHTIYYRVEVSNSNIVLEGSEIISVEIGEGKITFDSSKFITSPIHILSNDGNDLGYTYKGEMVDESYDGTINYVNSNTVTSLDNAYLVYSNLIKNAKFYDSITEEEIDATVTISEKKENSANFNYTISADGYDTLNGVVKFDYSEIGEVNAENNNDLKEITITLPLDYTVSLSEIATIVPSRASLSIEDDVLNYQTYYSIDEGKTWSTTSPKIKEAGEYNIYTLYCFVDKGNDVSDLVEGSINTEALTNLAGTGNFIISVQKIIVTE